MVVKKEIDQLIKDVDTELGRLKAEVKRLKAERGVLKAENQRLREELKQQQVAKSLKILLKIRSKLITKKWTKQIRRDYNSRLYF